MAQKLVHTRGSPGCGLFLTDTAAVRASKNPPVRIKLQKEHSAAETALRDELTAQKKIISMLEGKVAGLQSAFDETNALRLDAEHDREQLRAEIDTADATREIAQEAQQRERQKQLEVDEWRRLCSKLELDLQREQGAASSLRHERDQLQEKMRMDASDWKTMIDSLVAENVEHEQGATTAKERCAVLEAQHAQLLETSQALQARCEQEQSLNADLEAQLALLQADFAEKEKKATEHIRVLTAEKSRMSALLRKSNANTPRSGTTGDRVAASPASTKTGERPGAGDAAATSSKVQLPNKALFDPVKAYLEATAAAVLPAEEPEPATEKQTVDAPGAEEQHLFISRQQSGGSTSVAGTGPANASLSSRTEVTRSAPSSKSDQIRSMQNTTKQTAPGAAVPGMTSFASPPLSNNVQRASSTTSGSSATSNKATISTSSAGSRAAPGPSRATAHPSSRSSGAGAASTSASSSANPRPGQMVKVDPAKAGKDFVPPAPLDQSSCTDAPSFHTAATTYQELLGKRKHSKGGAGLNPTGVPVAARSVGGNKTNPAGTAHLPGTKVGRTHAASPSTGIPAPPSGAPRGGSKEKVVHQQTIPRGDAASTRPVGGPNPGSGAPVSKGTTGPAGSMSKSTEGPPAGAGGGVPSNLDNWQFGGEDAYDDNINEISRAEVQGLPDHDVAGNDPDSEDERLVPMEAG
ncbi:unnamed protein product [Amoebophrya sp. A120]|nr:unnamed protein product [Amoebophrya sp. A120]|eukprot:GSA120T00016717001.1